MTVAPQTWAQKSIRRHLFIGLAIVALIAGGVGGWAATTEISGAIIASGSIVVDSNVKKVQHATGGVVGEILAQNGSQVATGDVVVRLDATISTANLAVVRKRLTEMTARKARLEAEREGVDNIAFPEGLLMQAPAPTIARVLTSERKLFSLRRTARIGQQSQLRQRVMQLDEEIHGLTAQATAKSKEIVLIQRELKGARGLWDNNLMPISKLTALEREATRVEGERAQLTSLIARTKGRISETNLQIIQIDRDLASEVAKELSDIDAKIGEFVERKVAAEDQLKRADIRAPQAGTVHQSTAHTVGGVINAGEAIMLIVPKADNLTVEAKITPQDIDQLRLGQTAMLRFSAFNQRTTPEIKGTLSRVSADITTEERSGTSFYTVRIAMAADDIARLGAVTLLPGMPVEVFIKTGDRRVLSYLVKPLSDQITRAFREK
jgi:HlyD family secretion protein